MIRKVLVCSAAMAALSNVAFAADLPSSRAPVAPPPIPIFSWTGLYVGGQVGYGFGSDGAYTTTTATPLFAKPKGVLGGAHIGYNVQLPASNFVIGIEGDVIGSAYKGSETAVYSTKIPVEGSYRGRAGFAVDRALFYATGGVAFASFTDSYVRGDSVSTTRVGWTAGGGIQYAFTNEWSLRAEYRYADYGNFTDTLPIAGTSAVHHETESKVLGGFSYMFATPVPVVARY